MADPFSVAAGIITVLGAAEGVAKSLAKIKRLRNAPDELLALINEVSDFQVTLDGIQRHLIRNTQSWESSREGLGHVSTLANRAKDKLLQLDELIQYRLVRLGNPPGSIKVSRSEWARAKTTIAEFKQCLRDIKLDIITQILVANL